MPPAPTDLPRLVFMHVPKTGGTTLDAWMRPAFPGPLACPLRFAELYRHADAEIAAWRFFSGHFRMDEIDRIPAPRLLVTVLREPRARILSLYRFWRRVGLSFPDPAPGPRLARDLALADFLRSPEPEIRNAIDNSLARDLAGLVFPRPRGWVTGSPARPVTRAAVLERARAALRGFALVGFTEALDGFAAALAALHPALPPPATLPRLNATDGPREDLVGPVPAPAVDAAAEAALADLTLLDAVLVDEMRALVRPGEVVARPAGKTMLRTR